MEKSQIYDFCWLLIVLDDAVQPLPIGAAQLGAQISVYAGPTGQARDHYGWQSDRLSVQRIAERPYAPVHLSVESTAMGLEFSWIRRTRIGGDDWIAPEVPLGEDHEKYLLSFFKSGETKPYKRVEVSHPIYTYLEADHQADIQADRLSSKISVEVAQIGSQGLLGFPAKLQLI